MSTSSDVIPSDVVTNDCVLYDYDVDDTCDFYDEVDSIFDGDCA